MRPISATDLRFEATLLARRRMTFCGLLLLIALMLFANAALADADSSQSAPSTDPFAALAPPIADGPIPVWVSFEFHDINEIHDANETFEFSGVLIVKWRDPRRAFDPRVAGVQERIFQGEYQVNELAAGWFPQLVLVNESGSHEDSGVLLRVAADGSSTLVRAFSATAETQLKMTRFPFDHHRLELVFEALGYGEREVQLVLDPLAAETRIDSVEVPQWAITGSELATAERQASYGGIASISPAFIVSVDVSRKPFYMIRLIVVPLMVIVLLSFSVFWMDRSSLGDRISVSFIGILTGVAYQMVISSDMPTISYVTFMHGFLSLSFLTTGATVVINLIVGALDQRGDFERGDRIDRHCRWSFPLGYFSLLILIALIALWVL